MNVDELPLRLDTLNIMIIELRKLEAIILRTFVIKTGPKPKLKRVKIELDVFSRLSVCSL